MKAWIVKSAVQQCINALPASHRCNELFQRYVTKGLDLKEAEFESKLECCRHHLENFRNASTHSKEDFEAMEMGTGWFPVIPIGLYLSGARQIWTYDKVPLLRNFTLERTCELFCLYGADGSLEKLLPSILPERLEKLRTLFTEQGCKSPYQFLAELGIDAVIGDIENTELPDKSVDLVFSNVSLEHLTPSQLKNSFAEFKRIGRDDFVMSHHIGIADQFASFDSSITPFNFLQYTTSEWKRLDSPIIPQNRLRASDYKKLLEETGFGIVEQKNIPGSWDDLQSVQLSPEFQGYDEADLIVLTSWITAKPIL